MNVQARTARLAVSAAPVATIIPGTLFAIGGSVPPDRSVSWLPEGFEGWMPVQCYVFRDGGHGIVLDSGLAAHTRQIEAGLRQVLEDAVAPKALVSRWEPDCMVNLPWLIDRFGIREVLSYGGLNPLDFFEGFEAAVARAQVQAASGPATLVAIAPQEVLEVGALRIEVLTASLRLLLTSWFYEHTTHSLFTADSFGFIPNPRARAPFIARPDPAQLSPEALRRSLLTKFDWLAGAHSDSLIADLEALQDRFVVDRVCPGFGAVIEGRDNVATLFRSATIALRQLQSQPGVRPLAGFDWARALGPAAVADLADPRRMPEAAG